MKRILLLRHAKTEADHASGDDHARALTDRGKRDAASMGAFLPKNRYQPDQVLCSTSRRTVETWNILRPELGANPDIQFLDTLYLAPASRIMATIRGADDSAASVMIIGHNPGLEDCAHELARKARDDKERARQAYLSEKFPTCALAVFDCGIDDWSALKPRANTLVRIVRAKELRD